MHPRNPSSTACGRRKCYVIPLLPNAGKNQEFRRLRPVRLEANASTIACALALIPSACTGIPRRSPGASTARLSPRRRLQASPPLPHHGQLIKPDCRAAIRTCRSPAKYRRRLCLRRARSLSLIPTLTRLLTQDEVMQVRQKASKLRVAYTPPGG